MHFKGRYLWDTRNQDLVDWLVDVHLTGDVSPSELVNGVFLDDDWSNTGGAAENCFLKDCQHDMGLSTKDVADITDGWCNMMKRTQTTILDKGGFDWRMFSPGSGTCSGPPFAAGALTEGSSAGLQTCVEYMRQECSAGPNATLQESAMMYGLGRGCTLVTDKVSAKLLYVYSGVTLEVSFNRPCDDVQLRPRLHACDRQSQHESVSVGVLPRECAPRKGLLS